MARFEGRRESKGRSPRRNTGDFELNPRGRRDSGRGSRGRSNFRDRPRGGRDSRGKFDDKPRRRRDSRDAPEMTKVTCDSCGEQCEVPFKPTSSKPVYCSDCFGKQDKGGSNNHSNRDLDVINEKLNKIMKALKIDLD